MIDRKEVELLIRAQLQGKSDLAGVIKSIAELEKAIDSQAAAAKRGESNIDELKATLLALQQVQDNLKSKADLVGQFQRSGEAAQKAADRVQRSAKAYEDYKNKLEGLSDVTDKQQERLIKLSVAYERAQASQAKQQATQAKLAESLKESGIASDDLAGAENRVREAAAGVGLVIAKTQKTIASYADTVRTARTEADALAKSQKKLAEQTKLDKDFAASEGQAARAEAERAEIQRLSVIAAERTEAARRTAQAAEFVRRWSAALDEADAKEAELAKSNAKLNDTASAAEKAARGYTTLARASTDLRSKVVPLRDAINQIINPEGLKKGTLSGIEEQVRAVSKSISEIKGPVAEYRKQFADLAAAQKSIGNQADLIDGYKRQVEQLRRSREEFAAARAAVTQYAAQVRQGGQAGQQFVQPLAQAEARLRQVTAAMQAQVRETRASRDALQSAGISTSNLAAAEARLSASAQTATQATKQLADAVNKYGEASERSKKSGNLFGDEGRTTLSFAQRLRGEVLALASSYTGVFAAIGLADGALKAFQSRESLRSQFSISVGNDRALIDEEYAYVKAQAERIGVEFESTARGYAKFLASATLAGKSRQEIRYIFEAFSEVGRVAGLSKDELDGVFKALDQITSKGKIQAEELRGQLGDRLFGAFQVAAKALKDTYPDLDKALEKGLVTSDQLLAIAEEYRKTVGGGLASATTSLAANQARLNNAVEEFRTAIGDAGFAEAYLELIQKLTAFLRSDDGKKLAEQLGSAFTGLTKIIIFLLDNIDAVSLALQLLATSSAVLTFNRIAGAAVDAGKAIFTATGAIGKFSKALGVLGVLVASFQIGTFLRDQFLEVEVAGNELVVFLESAWVRIRGTFEEAFDDLPTFLSNIFVKFTNLTITLQKSLLGIFSKGARALGLDSLADNIDKGIQLLQRPLAENVNSKVAAIRRQTEEELARIRKIGDEMNADAVSRRNSGGVKAVAAQTEKPNASGGKGKPGPTDAEIKKRDNEIEAINKALETIETKIDRAQTDTLAKQLEAIDTQYAALKRRIDGLGGKEETVFRTRLEEDMQQLRLQTIKKFNDKLLDEQRALASKVEQVEAAAGRKQKDDLGARLKAITEANEAAYRDIEDARIKLQSNGRDTSELDALQKRLDLAVLELTVAEQQKYFKEEITRQEEKINGLLVIRKEAIAQIREQEANNEINSQQALDQVQAVIQSSQPAIDLLAQSSRAFADSLRGAVDPITLDTFIAKIEAARGSGARLNAELDTTSKLVRDGLGKALDAGIDSAITGLGEVASQTKSVGDAFKQMGRTVLQVVGDVVKELIKAAVRAAILRAIAGGGGATGATTVSGGGSIAANVAHTGGVIGKSSLTQRTVPSAWFANAPRYHSGGVAGLAPSEYPAILQKNEEVLKSSDPRNIMNGGAAAGGAGGGSTRVVLVDDRSRMAEALAGAEGERVVVQHIKANMPTIRQWLK